MKRFAITVLAVFAFILSLRAQVHIQEMSNYEPVGRNLLNQREIIAFKETFDVTIQRADFDSVTNTVLLTLIDEAVRDEKIVDSGIRHAVFFDLEHNELKWRKKYYRNEDIGMKNFTSREALWSSKSKGTTSLWLTRRLAKNSLKLGPACGLCISIQKKVG